MNAIKATVKSGRLEVDAPPEWPDGTEVLIEPTQGGAQAIGIDETQWRNDPESLADWDGWIRTIEPLLFTPEEVMRFAEFDQKMHVFNVDAVRRQMQDRNGE